MWLVPRCACAEVAYILPCKDLCQVVSKGQQGMRAKGVRWGEGRRRRGRGGGGEGEEGEEEGEGKEEEGEEEELGFTMSALHFTIHITVSFLLTPLLSPSLPHSPAALLPPLLVYLGQEH